METKLFLKFYLNNVGINYYSQREIYMVNKKIILLFVSLLLISSVNVGSSSEIPVILPMVPNLAQMIQVSDIIVEVTVVDMAIKKITLNDSMDMPYEIQSVNYTLKVNEILKPNQDIEIEEEIIIDRGQVQDLNIGDHAILIKKANGIKNYPDYVLLIREGKIYSDSDYQINLEDLKTLAKKSDDYYEKYSRAFHSRDIVVAKMLTDTDVNQMEYGQWDALPHQTHKVQIINSTTGKLTGNIELDYEIWYFPEKILKENNLTWDVDIAYPDWIKTSDGYYFSDQWDPNSSFLKKGDYYVICVSYYDEKEIWSIEHIEKYDSKTKKELRELIEEYQEIYKQVQKYEMRR